ncbi:GyrI-like domain-containing protein, partial [Acinetobacter baumannii]
YDAWQDSSGGDIWIGFPVSDDFTPSGEVRVEVIPSGRAVMAVHDGPYTEMRSAWDAAIEVMARQGLSKGRFSWEDYVD